MTVELADVDCPGWLYVAKGDTKSWVRDDYLSPDIIGQKPDFRYPVGPSGPSSGNPLDPRTPEHKLATLQKGPIAASDPLVAEFGRQLDGLADKCTDARLRLADYTVTAHRQMEERGVRDSHLSIITALNASIPPVAQRLECAQMFAAYVVLRIRG